MGLAFAGGVVVGVRTLSVPATATREFVVGVPNPPSLVVECRDLAALDPNDPRSLVPVLSRLSTQTNRPTLDVLLDGKSPLPLRLVGKAADEFTVAFYPAGEGAYHYVLLAKLRPLARLGASVISFRPVGVRYRGHRIVRLGGGASPIHTAFFGRLMVLSDSRAALERTLDGIRDGSGGFLLRSPSPEGRRRLVRLQGQSPDRIGSFYVRPRPVAGSSVEEYYGELRRDGEAWDLDVWVRAFVPRPSVEDILAARTLALRAPASARLTLWHSALSWRWFASRVLVPLGLSWSDEKETGDVSAEDVHVPMVFAIGEGSGKVLPEFVALFATRESRLWRDELRRGRLPVRLNGVPLTVRRQKGDAVDVVRVPFSPEIEYEAGIGALPEAFVVGSTEDVVRRAVGKPERTFGAMIPETPNVADLFYLRSRPASLAEDAQRTAELLRLAARFSGSSVQLAQAESFAKWVRLCSLFAAVDVDGLTTPDGYRLFIRVVLEPMG